MKKLLGVLVTMMAVSTVFACPGGDLVQVTVEDAGKTLVAANYNIRTGIRTFVSSRVKSMATGLIDGSSACTSDDCEQLIQMGEGRRVQFVVTLDDGRVLRKTIAGVKINMNNPVAKAGPPIPGSSIGVQDSEGQMILNCSKK